MRPIVGMLAAFGVFLCTSAQAASELDAATQQKLVQLERKYFGHSFDADSDDSRATRLEKFILGEAAEGAPKQRLEKLVNMTAESSPAVSASQGGPTAEAEVAPPEAPSRPSRHTKFAGSSRGHVDTKPNVNTASNSNSAAPASSSNSETRSDTDSDSDAVGAGSYPHVSALENAILGQGFESQPLPARLKRMETKAFGKPSDNPDLSQRIDALDDYSEQKLHKKLVPTVSEVETETAMVTTDRPEQQSPGDYPRVTALENAILGQSFAGQPLPDRLSRMEVKAFGSSTNALDLSQRTDALETYAERKLHKKPLDVERRQAEAADRSNQPPNNRLQKTVASMVGNTLLGMAGMGRMGFGGIGPGFMGPGTRNGQHGARQEQSEPKPETPPDDPAVLTALPPPPAAKMLIKVGWCEVQVFGQTYPTMHLPERLGQLNRQLNFRPGKSNTQLLDDIAALIKAVQAQKQPAIPTASKAPSTVH